MNRKIHARIRAMVVPRYRYVIQVLLLEHNGQEAMVSTRCLWDQDRDNFTYASFSNVSMTVIATCHTLYLE